MVRRVLGAMALVFSPLTSAMAQTGTVTGVVSSDFHRVVVGAEVAYAGTVVTTDSAGVFTLAAVPSGQITIRVSAEAHATRELAVLVPSGGTISVNVFLASVMVLREITVTAQKREQFIKDVGISMTALEGTELEKVGMVTTTDLLSQVPSVYMQDATGSPGETVNISVRGVGLNDFNDGTEAPSVLYVDEFYVLPISGASMMLHDLARVEVLRGPQGTLFGRNVTGGLVHLVTADPTDRQEGSLRTGVGSFGLRRVEGVVNVPVARRAALRFSGLVNDHGPWVRNLGSAPDGQEADLNSSLRGQIGWRTDRLSSVTKITRERAKGNVSLTQGDREAQVNAAGFVIDAGPGPFVDREAAEDPRVGQTDAPEFIDNEKWLGTQRFVWDLGDVEITSVTGYLDLDRLRVQDCDGTPLNTCRTNWGYHAKEFTQELRASGSRDGLQWTLGAYHLRQDADATADAVLDADGAFGGGVPGFGFGGPFIFDVDWDSRVRGWAGFGNVEVALSPAWSLTAGLRFSRDSKSFEMLKRDFFGVPGSEAGLNADYDNLYPGVYVDGIGANINFTRNGPPLPVDSNFDLVPDVSLAPAGDLTRRKDNLVNAKIGLDWRPTEDALFYGSWSRGTKSGGFNNGFITVSGNADIPFGSETLNAFETGAKVSFGQVMRSSVSVFHYIYDDYQAASLEGLGTRTLNKDATLTGGEFEFSIYPFVGLEAQGGVSLLRTEVRNINNGVSTYDAKMGLAPTRSAKGLVRYSWLLGQGTASAQADMYWASEQFMNVLNHPGLKLPAHGVGNLRAAYAVGDWEFEAWVRNVTNKRVANTRFTLGFGTIMTWYRDPRWFGLSAQYRW